LIVRVVAAVVKYGYDLEPVKSSAKAHAVDETFFFGTQIWRSQGTGSFELGIFVILSDYRVVHF
jgi:hypothetical protein